MKKIVAYALSNIGNVRDKHEDNFFIPQKCFIDSEKQKEIKTNDVFIGYEYEGEDGVFVVCDGMGGHSAGEVASRLAVEKVFSFYDDLLKSDKDSILKFIKDLNDYICDYSEKNPECNNMGTTFSGLIISDANLHLVHVGDSRIYQFTDGILKQISIDHTEGKRLLDAGILKPENLSKFPNRKSLYKYLGRKGNLVADCEKIDDAKKSRYIISSDGLSDTLTNDEISDIMKQNFKPKGICYSLINKCLEKGDKCTDNVTVICVSLEEI